MLLLQSVEETHSATAASPQEVKATYGGQKCLLSSGLQGAGRLHCLTQQDRGMPADSPVAVTWSRLLAAVHAWSSSSSTQQAAPSHHSLHANLQSCSPRLRKAKPCHWLRWKRERIPQYKERVGWGRYRRLCPVVKSRAVKVRNHSSVSRAGLTLVPLILVLLGANKAVRGPLSTHRRQGILLHAWWRIGERVRKASPEQVGFVPSPPTARPQAPCCHCCPYSPARATSCCAHPANLMGKAGRSRDSANPIY